ncbi:hypothetical protein ACFW1A_11450 [Kitasatospora sp. NPDC058965]|uniref:hypothetical protein n=1 Tax=Kitasatospora sp. NPDC058965 TaxID=3346682 RepID=UPI0036A18560
MHQEAADAVYELVISVDVRRSSGYDDKGKARMREQLYAVLGRAFQDAGVPGAALHREDRGDGVLAVVRGTVAPVRLVGLWLTEVHEGLRLANAPLREPLGLRIGMHVGPVTHDPAGVSGAAVDLACRLADAQPARELLDRERADLVVVASDRLFHEVISHGGRFVDPDRYARGLVRVKETETVAWFLLPGRPRPEPAGPAAAPPPDPDAGPDAGPGAGADAAADPGPGIRVGGDFSVHENNTYRGPVHIGRRGDRA